MSDIDLVTGLQGSASLTVGAEHTAQHFGSGTAAVFASPMMVVLMERAAVACIEARLPAGSSSLGTRLVIDHIAATPVGAPVTATATLTAVDGRTLTFDVEARDGHEVIGKGQHIRVIVDRERFLSKLSRKSPSGP